MTEQALTFHGVVIVLTITPGADMALVMRNVLVYGRPSIAPTLAGVFSGLAVHVASCVIGLSLVLARSHTAFTIVKVAGAAYLIWLGVQGLLVSRRAAREARADSATVEARAALADAERGGLTGDGVGGASASASDGDGSAVQMPAGRLYRQGLLGNLLNVKIALFYLSFLPQFAHPGPGFLPRALGLALVQGAIGFTWLTVYGLLIARAADRARSDQPSRTKAFMERFTGIALIAFGLRLALAVK